VLSATLSRTMVEVKLVINPAMLIEIEADAVDLK
jgi:hypothetical protein